MPTLATMGHEAKLSIGGTAMPFVSETLTKRQVVLERQGLRGVRGRDLADLATGPYTVEGTIVVEPSSAELAAIWTLAGITSTTTAMTEVVPTFSVVIHRGAAATIPVRTYANCKLSRLTVSSSQGGLVQASLDIIGRTEAESGSVAEPESSFPMSHANSTFTLNSVTTPCAEYTFTIDNALEARFLMSLTATDQQEGDRRVTLSTGLPLTTANKDLVALAVTGVPAVLVIGDGTNTHTITMPTVTGGAETPTVGGRGETTIPINIAAYKDVVSTPDTGEASVVVAP